MDIDKISPTQLNVLRECPRCFWLARHGIKRPSTPMSTVPRKIDSAVSSLCAPYRGTNQLPDHLAQLAGRLVEPLVSAQVEPASGFTFRGYLDECVELPGPEYAPLDHKARGYPVREVHDAYHVQLDSYALLLELNGLTPAAYGLLVYFVLTDEPNETGFPYDVTVIEVDTDPDRARELLVLARDVQDLQLPPAADGSCEYCRWVSEAISA